MSTGRTPYGGSPEALIDAAIRLVAREGLPRLTGRALAREAGVSNSGLYYHFESIESVLVAALDRSYGLSIPPSENDPELKDLFQMMIDKIHRQDEIAVFQFEVILASRRRPELQAAVKRAYARYRESMTKTLAKLNVHDEEAIELFLALGDGMTYQLTALGEPQLKFAQLQAQAVSRLVNSYRETSAIEN